MPVECTPAYRLILRPVPYGGGNPEDELRNINVGPIPSGVLAYCDQVDVLYRLDKSYSGPAVASVNAVTPIAGGGIWRKLVNGGYSTLFQTNDEAVTNPVALPLGDTVVLLGTQPFVLLATDPDATFGVNAAVEVIPGATPGGSVTCFLERQINAGAWVIVDQRNTGVLPATEAATVPLIAAGPMGTASGTVQSLLFRIRCNAATQACIANNAHYTALGFMH